MKQLFLGASLVAVSIFAIASAAPALADGPVQVRLGDGSRPYKAPLQVQLLNESPRITDHRGSPAETVYEFNMPPMPAAATEIVRMGAPAGTTGNSNGGGPIAIRSGYLPKATFGSNIPEHTLARSLPQGTSTNGLKNTSIDWSGGKHPIASSGLAHPRSTRPQTTDGPTTATYGTSSGGATSSNQHTESKVTGNVMKGSLLKK